MSTSYTFTSAAAAPTKEIKRAKNWATGRIEWDMYLDGRYVGSRDRKEQAEIELNALVYESLRRAA